MVIAAQLGMFGNVKFDKFGTLLIKQRQYVWKSLKVSIKITQRRPNNPVTGCDWTVSAQNVSLNYII